MHAVLAAAPQAPGALLPLLGRHTACARRRPAWVWDTVDCGHSGPKWTEAGSGLARFSGGPQVVADHRLVQNTAGLPGASKLAPESK